MWKLTDGQTDKRTEFYIYYFIIWIATKQQTITETTSACRHHKGIYYYYIYVTFILSRISYFFDNNMLHKYQTSGFISS